MTWKKSVEAGKKLDKRLSKIKAKNPQTFMTIQLLIESGRL